MRNSLKNWGCLLCLSNPDFKRKKQDRNALAHGPIPTGRKGKVVDKAYLFNQFSVNFVIIGETLLIG